MSQYQWILTVIGMMIGLGVTRILTCLAAVVRSRDLSRPDWISLVWAATILIMELDFWWSLFNIVAAIKEWTFAVFLLLLIHPLLMFFAAAMVLPSTELKSGENYRELYDRHGHWALLAISGYFLEMLVENSLYWKVTPDGWAAMIPLALAVLPMVAFFSSRRFQGAIAVVHFIICVTFVFVDPVVLIDTNDMNRH